jgi:hypothetical protein
MDAGYGGREGLRANFHQKNVFKRAQGPLQSGEKSAWLIYFGFWPVPGSAAVELRPLRPERESRQAKRGTRVQARLKAMTTICKHPRVRVVSRHEDTEFVECLECGEVFDSEEFRDMAIEETAEEEEADS